MKRLLCESAQSAVRTRCQFKGLFEQLKIRRGFKRAIMAVGHKQLTIVYTMLKTGKHYQDPGIDYEKMLVMRNAPRWIRQLRKYGYVK